MPFLRDASIQRKLMAITMLTTCASLLLACAAFVVYELVLFRESMKQDIQAVAEIIGHNSFPGLTFNAPADTEEILNSLRAKPHIVAAAIIDSSGDLFAAYNRDGPNTQKVLPEKPWTEGARFVDGHLELFHPISSEGELAGTVYIQSELDEMYSRLRQYSRIVLIVLLLSSGLALLLSSALQRIISRPILKLVETTRAVSSNKDYSVRAPKHGEDELGQFTDAFNSMLAQIQIRDAALQRARDELEIRVEERTKELQQEIAERKEKEQQLEAVAAKLERSNNELQAFAYVASHDLQEPLRKVQAFGDRLKAKCAEQITDEGKDYLDRMQNAARRMQNLISDLLLFSRVTTQARPFELVHLSNVVREVLSDLEIRVQQTEGVVQSDSLPVIEADPLQMRQLFQNLLSNALKFHRPGTPPHVRITSRTMEEPATVLGPGIPTTRGYCEIKIEDNGIGFEQKYADRIFAVFQRLHARHTYEGTGVGLAICRKIVERHGGSIAAFGTPEQGAAFVIRLPLTQKKVNHERN